MDERIIKVSYNNKARLADELPIHPYCILPYTPASECVFDSRHGTIGFDIFPFAVTTRIAAACEVYLKVYEDLDHTDEGQRSRGDRQEHSEG